MRRKFHMSVMIPEDPDADENDAVAKHDKCGEPQRQPPAGSPPVDERKRNHPREQQCLVCDGVDECPKLRALVETPGDPAVHSIRRCRENKNSECPPAHGLNRVARLHRVAVVKCQRHIDRHQADSNDGDLARKRHCPIQAEQWVSRNPKFSFAVINTPERPTDRRLPPCPRIYSSSIGSPAWCHDRLRSRCYKN